MKKIILSCVVIAFFGCDVPTDKVAKSGVKELITTVETNSQGITIEQKNVRNRLIEDNKPGAIKHLYVISSYSGQVIIYSTVDGKVTSGGKRLSPIVRISSGGDFYHIESGEDMGDDGTYGSSGDYVYWWDVKGVYHQHYLTGGQIIHVSSVPIPVKGVIINMEIQ